MPCPYYCWLFLPAMVSLPGSSGPRLQMMLPIYLSAAFSFDEASQPVLVEERFSIGKGPLPYGRSSL